MSVPLKIRIKTLEEFVERSNKVHDNKYDYSKVKFINNREHVVIICKIHGDFEQPPRSHYSGRGCVKCFHDKLTMSNDKFIEKSKKIHGNKYDYSKVVYVKSYKNVIIICKTHGDFKQQPSNHLYGSGCPNCSYDSQKTTNLLTNDQFIEKSKKIHGSKYDYTNTKYISVADNINLRCNVHNINFVVNVTSHLRMKNNNTGGCPNCVYDHLSKTRSKSQEQFLEACKKTHSEKYNYSKTLYTGDHKKIIIICNIHGEFKQQAGVHSRGQGCPYCTTYKNENECRQIIEKLTKCHFIKERPKFLNKLEYDGYNDDLKIAFEYNGEQHYYYIPFFHYGKKANLEKQKKHDLLKKELSHNNGVFLIVIPYFIEDKESFISSQLEFYQFLRICL